VKPNPRFQKQPKTFWATVRLISQVTGYVSRVRMGPGPIKVPTLDEMADALKRSSLDPAHVLEAPGAGNELGRLLFEYFQYRADVLNNDVRSQLMDRKQALTEYQALRERYPNAIVPMNKQSGEKRVASYLSGMVNILIESNLGGLPCDFNPRQLTTVTKDSVPLRTLSRWFDGAFPSPVNPIAVWEIKEYYFTTTFGSRVADGVYESLLDGLELEELREHEDIDILHYLIVDAYDTWWNKGRSYLCRIIDMLHMGYVDEVLFGREILTRLPTLAKELRKLGKARGLHPER
jgi:hypothetical protein